MVCEYSYFTWYKVLNRTILTEHFLNASASEGVATSQSLSGTSWASFGWISWSSIPVKRAWKIFSSSLWPTYFRGDHLPHLYAKSCLQGPSLAVCKAGRALSEESASTHSSWRNNRASSWQLSEHIYNVDISIYIYGSVQLTVGKQPIADSGLNSHLFHHVCLLDQNWCRYTCAGLCNDLVPDKVCQRSLS